MPENRCKHCGRLDIDAHKAWCIHAPNPDPDPPAEADPERYGAREDSELAQRIGEPVDMGPGPFIFGVDYDR